MKNLKAYWVADSTAPVSELDLIYLFLSVNFWKKNQNTQTILFTDENHFNLYKKMEIWDEIRVFEFGNEIDKRSNKFWAAGKLQAMKNFETPFAILDLDMFFTDKIVFDVDIIAAHNEDGTGYYFDEHNPIIKKAGIVPLRRDSYALNVSFLYIKNKEFKDKYVNIALDWMKRISEIGDVEGGHMTFCEQKLLYDLVITENVSHKTIIPNESNCPQHRWIPELDESISPFHHLSTRKHWVRKDEHLHRIEKSKVLFRLKKEFPELIKPCFNFIEKNKDML